MQMKKTILSVMLACVAVVDAAACTSAIISGSLTADGRPILWKHRDTSDLNNKVERIDAAAKIPYVALFNLQSEERHGLGNG